MSQPFEMTITVQDIESMEPFATGSVRLINAKKINFMIEPPIEIYTEDLFNSALRRQAEDVKRAPYYGQVGIYNDSVLCVGDIRATHSDKQATHGEIELLHTDPPLEDMQAFITSTFEEALNPMGNIAINVNFLTPAPSDVTLA